MAGRGWDTRVPQVKTAEGRFRQGFEQAEQRFACGGIGTLAVVFRYQGCTRTHTPNALSNACTLRCSAKPLDPQAVVISVCDRAQPFHTKHPVGKTHNFYTTQSRWSHRPFEVLFVGHLQAFLITGSLQGASLSPGFCLPVLGGEGALLGLHSAWRAPVKALCWSSLGKVDPGLGVCATGIFVALGIFITLGHPLCRSIL